MKAIFAARYGTPEQLAIVDVPKPVPKPNEVLIRVRASAVNDWDVGIVEGKPLVYRPIFGLFKPRLPIPGMEVSGIVEEVGPAVTLFKSGDAVYGDISNYGTGAFADFVCVHELGLTHKPDEMSFEEAAAIPHASMLAYQGLVDIGKIRPGQKILINGAGGGVGTFGLQIARHIGASHITGVDNGEKLEMMRSIGFDHVIDYQREDFTSNGQTYDLVLDAKSTRGPKEYLRALNPGGRYVTVGGDVKRLLQIFFASLIQSKKADKTVHIVALKSNKDLDYVNDLFRKGKLRPVIDGPYRFDEIPRLISYFAKGKHKGKVVISMR